MSFVGGCVGADYGLTGKCQGDAEYHIVSHCGDLIVRGLAFLNEDFY